MTLRGCLKSPSLPSTPGTPNTAALRKSVAFCAECDGLEEVHTADEWDRTPTEPAKTPLSYQDILELKAIQRTLPRAPQLPDLYTGKPASHYLCAVPIGLLPLLPADHPGTPHPTPVSTPGGTPAGSAGPSPAGSRSNSREHTPSHTPSGSTSQPPTMSSMVEPSPSSISSSLAPTSPSKMEPNPLLALYPNPPHSPPGERSPGHTPHFPYSYTYTNSYSTTPGHMPGRLKPAPPILPLTDAAVPASNATPNAANNNTWRNYVPDSRPLPGAKISPPSTPSPFLSLAPSSSSYSPSPLSTPTTASTSTPPTPSASSSSQTPTSPPPIPSYLAHLFPRKVTETPKRKPNIPFVPLLDNPPAVSPPSSAPSNSSETASSSLFSPIIIGSASASGDNASRSGDDSTGSAGSAAGGKPPSPNSIVKVLEGLSTRDTTPTSVVFSRSSLSASSMSRTSSADSYSDSEGSCSAEKEGPTKPNTSEDQNSSSFPSYAQRSSDMRAYMSGRDAYDHDHDRDTAPPTPALTTTSLMTEESELDTDDGDEFGKLGPRGGFGNRRVEKVNPKLKPSTKGDEEDSFENGLGLHARKKVVKVKKTITIKVKKEKEKKKEVMWINDMEVEIDVEDDGDGEDEYEDKEVEVEVEEEVPAAEETPKALTPSKKRYKKEVMYINGMEMEIDVTDDEAEAEAGMIAQNCESLDSLDHSTHRNSTPTPTPTSTMTTTTTNLLTPTASSSSFCPSHQPLDYRIFDDEDDCEPTSSISSPDCLSKKQLGCCKPQSRSKTKPSLYSISPSSSLSPLPSPRSPSRPPPLSNHPGERIVSLPEVPTRARTPVSTPRGSGTNTPVPGVSTAGTSTSSATLLVPTANGTTMSTPSSPLSSSSSSSIATKPIPIPSLSSIVIPVPSPPISKAQLSSPLSTSSLASSSPLKSPISPRSPPPLTASLVSGSGSGSGSGSESSTPTGSNYNPTSSSNSPKIRNNKIRLGIVGLA